MTHRNKAVLSTCAAVLLAGCAAPIETSGQLLDRLGAAQQISVTAPRESALAQIAKDAAASGQPSLCQQAVDGINQSMLHDQTCADCADTLNGRGDRISADALVGKINSVAERDRLREAYAAQVPPMARF